MKKAEAMKIFSDLKNEDYSVLDKVEAIVEVAEMPSHNSVKKADMVEAIRFLAAVMKNVLEAEKGEPEENVG